MYVQLVRSVNLCRNSESCTKKHTHGAKAWRPRHQTDSMVATAEPTKTLLMRRLKRNGGWAHFLKVRHTLNRVIALTPHEIRDPSPREAGCSWRSWPICEQATRKSTLNARISANRETNKNKPIDQNTPPPDEEREHTNHSGAERPSQIT